jgi:hypothetical protein
VCSAEIRLRMSRREVSMMQIVLLGAEHTTYRRPPSLDRAKPPGESGTLMRSTLSRTVSNTATRPAVAQAIKRTLPSAVATNALGETQFGHSRTTVLARSRLVCSVSNSNSFRFPALFATAVSSTAIINPKNQLAPPPLITQVPCGDYLDEGTMVVFSQLNN